MSYSLKIMTPQGVAFEGEVDSLSVPGDNGYFGVLSSHAQMVSAIGTGVLKLENAGNIQYFVISGGVAEVNKDGTILLADIVKKVANPDEAEIEIQEMNSPTPTGH